MGSAIAPLAEIWLPHILRLVTIKTQVIQSAADRCLRIIMSIGANHPTGGLSRLLTGALAESCGSKSAGLRYHVLEYIVLACALWNIESLEKYVSLKSYDLLLGHDTILNYVDTSRA